MLIIQKYHNGNLYRLLQVQKIKKIYFLVNCFNPAGALTSVKFKTFCSAVKYFNQFNNKSKRCSNGKTKNSFNAGLF